MNLTKYLEKHQHQIMENSGEKKIGGIIFQIPPTQVKDLIKVYNNSEI